MDITLYSNECFGEIRVIVRDGDPWFVAKDVCEALDLSNVGMALDRLDQDEKITISLADGNRGNPNTAIVSEPGLYSLVLGSRKPEAKDFKRWITHDVIPSIRKTGAYQIAPKDYASALRALAAEVEQKEAIKKALAEEKQQHELDNRDFKEGLDILNSKCAEIANRQVATALSTASAKSRENKRLTAENEHLKDECGRGQNWRTLSEMEPIWQDKYHHGPSWRKLLEFCQELKIQPIKDVRSTFRDGKGQLQEKLVNRYHIKVWDRYMRYEDLMKVS